MFLLIAVAETIQGIWRVRVLNRRVGDKKARQIGLLSGSAIILVLSLILIHWVKPSSPLDAFIIGGIWVLLMVSFDISIGRFAFKMKWKRILRDFNPREGGYLGFGMLFLFFCPVIVYSLRAIVD